VNFTIANTTKLTPESNKIAVVVVVVVVGDLPY
jgi:hypothetical protein